MNKNWEEVREKLKKFKNKELNDYCLKSGLKYGLKGKYKIMRHIYESEGGANGLMNVDPKEKRKTENKKHLVNETDLMNLKILEEEICGTMQHTVVNKTKNCKFGFIKREEIERIFGKLEKGKNKYSVRRSGRYQNGKIKKEVWFEKDYYKNFPKILTKDYTKRCYVSFSIDYFSKNQDLYRKEKPRAWNFKLKKLKIKYNYNRQYLLFSTKFQREAWREDLKRYDERC